MIAVIAYINFFDRNLRQVVVDVGPEDTWKDSLKTAIDMGVHGPDGHEDEHKTTIDALPMNFEEAQNRMMEGDYQVTFTLL